MRARGRAGLPAHPAGVPARDKMHVVRGAMVGREGGEGGGPGAQEQESVREGGPALAVNGTEGDEALPQRGEVGERERRAVGRCHNAHGAPPWTALPRAMPYSTRSAPANIRLMSRLRAVSAR